MRLSCFGQLSPFIYPPLRLYAVILFNVTLFSKYSLALPFLLLILLLTILQSSLLDSVFLTAGSVWALCYFSHFAYLLFLFSAVFYLLPNLVNFTLSNNYSKSSSFTSTEGLDLVMLALTPLFLILAVHFTWSGPSLVAWFGHIVFSSFQYKITYLLFIFVTSYWSAFLMTTHFSSTNVYDYSITVFNFFIWLWFMFFSNNVFTFIFFLELLSASITLLLVTSTFSSSYFYNNLSYSTHSYFQTSTPTALLHSLMLFFWITLVASLMLFLFTIFAYLKFFSFDWGLTDSIFLYLVATSSIKSLMVLTLVWSLLIVCLFLKCGIVPFYFWKPSFFKGMTITSLFFYTYVYYFSLFLYFVYVLFVYFNEIFFLNLYPLTVLLVLGTFGLTSILLESLYIKSFLALSSILNSVLILYALPSFQASDFLFII